MTVGKELNYMFQDNHRRATVELLPPGVRLPQGPGGSTAAGVFMAQPGKNPVTAGSEWFLLHSFQEPS